MLGQDIVQMIPISKATVFNTSLPSAEQNWLSSSITSTYTPSYLNIYVCVDTAGVFRVSRTVSGTTVTENMNGGTNLTANAGYLFTVEVRAGDSINVRYSVTSGTIKVLRIDEIGSAV